MRKVQLVLDFASMTSESYTNQLVEPPVGLAESRLSEHNSLHILLDDRAQSAVPPGSTLNPRDMAKS